MYQNLTMKILLPLLLLAIAMNSFADWKVEDKKNFKGERQVYLVTKSSDGSEFWVDLQKQQLVFQHRGKVLNEVDGVKIDGKLYEVQGSATGDGLDSAVICPTEWSYVPDLDCYKAIFNSKKLEVNVDYFRTGKKVSTFNINASPSTYDKYYKERTKQ